MDPAAVKGCRVSSVFVAAQRSLTDIGHEVHSFSCADARPDAMAASCAIWLTQKGPKAVIEGSYELSRDLVQLHVQIILGGVHRGVCSDRFIVRVKVDGVKCKVGGLGT